MKLEERFHEDVIQFEVEKIAMIGNNRTGNLIGLTEEGKKAVAILKMRRQRKIEFYQRIFTSQIGVIFIA